MTDWTNRKMPSKTKRLDILNPGSRRALSPADFSIAKMPHGFKFLGFEVSRSESRENRAWTKGGVYRVPYWFLAIVFGAAPFQRWRARRRRCLQRRRIASGLCACCGYDLRASRSYMPGVRCKNGKGILKVRDGGLQRKFQPARRPKIQIRDDSYFVAKAGFPSNRLPEN